MFCGKVKINCVTFWQRNLEKNRLSSPSGQRFGNLATLSENHRRIAIGIPLHGFRVSGGRRSGPRLQTPRPGRSAVLPTAKTPVRVFPPPTTHLEERGAISLVLPHVQRRDAQEILPGFRLLECGGAVGDEVFGGFGGGDLGGVVGVLLRE